MNCKKTLLLLFLMQTGFAMAGGLLTNTNQSVHFLRNPARDASTDIDAVYANPAGLVKLDDGFHFSITNQSAFQTRTIRSTSPVFVCNGGNDTKEFKGTASVPIIPSFQGVYKKGKWVLSGEIAIVGGGGKATFDNGLPSFEVLSGSIVSFANAAGLTTDQYSVNQYMKGTSYIFGGQIGGTYEINKNFSAYLGFRLNVVSNSYSGSLTDLKINTAAGSTVLVSAYSVTQALLNSGLITDATQLAYLNILDKAASDDGARLDSKQSGWGVSPIIGFDYFWNDKLTIGAKLEIRTPLNVENNTKRDDTGMFEDGVNTAYDVPSLLALGASYKVLPRLTASVGYHHFFDSKAKMENDKQKNAGSTNEFLVGAEYQIDKMFLVSAGFQKTNYGVNDNYQKDLSFACDSYSIGLGGAVNVSSKVKLNVGYFWTNYSDYTKEPGGGTTKDVFSRTNKVFGAGVDFSF